MSAVGDELGRLWRALAAATDAATERQWEERAARRNAPEARLIRSKAAQAGWERRRAREGAQRAVWEAEAARDDELAARRGSGPWCGSMFHDSVGHEVFCILHPDHVADPGEDCEDETGYSWPNPSTW